MGGPIGSSGGGTCLLAGTTRTHSNETLERSIALNLWPGDNRVNSEKVTLDTHNSCYTVQRRLTPSEAFVKMSARSTLVGAALASAVFSAASAEAQATKTKDSTGAQSLKGSADLIVKEQLASRTFSNAYAAIEALRGNWLRVRNLNPPPGTVINPVGGSAASQGSASPAMQSMPREASGIQVYVDGVRAGGLEVLKSIPVQSIYSMRRISGTDAQARFGIGHSDGVIFVATGPDKGGG